MWFKSNMVAPHQKTASISGSEALLSFSPNKGGGKKMVKGGPIPVL